MMHHANDSSYGISSTSQKFRQAVDDLIDSELTTKELHEVAMKNLTMLPDFPEHNVPEWLSLLLRSDRHQGKQFTLEGLLQQMYNSAPSESATRRYVAAAICSCANELVDDNNRAVQLANNLQDLATT